MKNSLVSFAVALALTGLACGTALAQVGPGFYNDDYLNSTGAAATSLDLTFSGDLTAALSGGGFVASFPYPGGTVLTGTIPQNTPVNGLTVTDSYDAGTNTTTLVYSGTASVVSGLSAMWGIVCWEDIPAKRTHKVPHSYGLRGTMVEALCCRRTPL